MKKANADLEFLEKFRDADLIPRFLQFKLANRRLKHSSENIRSKRRFLDVEIRSKNRRIKYLTEFVNTLKHQFKSQVRSIDYGYYLSIIRSSVDKDAEIWYAKHQRKFTSLRVTFRLDAGLLNPDDVIVNQSDYSLLEVEKLALSNGLKFSLLPQKLKTGSYLSNIEALNFDLRNATFVGSDEDELCFKKTLSEIAFSSMFNFNTQRSSLINIP